MTKKLILASQSPRRLELLSLITQDFEVVISGVEENYSSTNAADIAQELSYKKATAVFYNLLNQASYEDVKYQVEDVVVIGADTIVSVDGYILEKPVDSADAYRMIELLQGKTHAVHTGVSIISADYEESFTSTTRVHVSAMSDDEIQQYITSDEPYDKAGAYGIQGSFAKFIQSIEGDYNTVVGLPVARLYESLKNMINL